MSIPVICLVGLVFGVALIFVPVGQSLKGNFWSGNTTKIPLKKF